eukprot:m.72684 g.72684  ORF g.72684 m.72684 type:complete len:276 (-) comp11751_c0_seq1:113-940(-)
MDDGIRVTPNGNSSSGINNSVGGGVGDVNELRNRFGRRYNQYDHLDGNNSIHAKESLRRTTPSSSPSTNTTSTSTTANASNTSHATSSTSSRSNYINNNTNANANSKGENEGKEKEKEKEKDDEDEGEDNTTPSSFSCRICLDTARDPVVTRCGHLYCWPCLHEWLSQKEECPVCKAGVTKENIIPLYITEETTDPREQEVPTRPQAERPPNLSNNGHFRNFFNNQFGVPFFQFEMNFGGGGNDANLTEEQRRMNREAHRWLLFGLLVLVLLFWF